MKEEKSDKIKVKTIFSAYYKDEEDKTIEQVVLKLIEMEQKYINESINNLRIQLTEYKDKKDDTEKFLSIIRKYTQLKELDASILNEMIEKILIYDTETVNGEKQQRMDIYYRFVGIL